MGTGAEIAIVAAVVAATASGVGAYMQSSAAKAQAKYQAKVADYNSEVALQNAREIREVGEANEAAARAQIARTKGAARARLAGSGLLVDASPDDTASLLIQDLAAGGELDIQNIKRNTAIEERNAELQAENYDLQAGLFNLSAKQQKPLVSAGLAFASSAGQSAMLLSSRTPSTSTTSTSSAASSSSQSWGYM